MPGGQPTAALPRGRRALLAASAILLLFQGSLCEGEPAAEELAVDDECSAEDSSCALNALQRQHARGAASRQGLLEPSSQNESAGSAGDDPYKEDCEDCMQKNFEPSAQILGAAPIRHYAFNCWHRCGGRAGSCPSFCGAGNACCRYRYRSDPPECKDVAFWPVLSWHTCVQPVHKHVEPEGPTLAPPGSATGYFPQVRALGVPSEAPVLSFYMYRAAGDDDYPPENVNAANLAGVLWYLHNEVVVVTPRKFGITRIIRMKVSTKAPQPLLEAGMNFGVRYAFDSGRCTGPWNCNQQFAKYGYFVGCNMVGNFPTDKWRHENRYPNAIWYSLPGPCSSRRYDSHDDSCTAVEPGGACAGGPTGRGNCTYSYEPAGEISIDELEGIADYQTFIKGHGHEYIHRIDRGVGMTFWNGKRDPAKCQARIDAAEKLFAEKFGEPEPLDSPKCDFDYHGFYR